MWFNAQNALWFIYITYDLEIDYSWDKTYFKEALREKKRGILKIVKAVKG